MHVRNANPRWWGKRFRYSRRLRNSQFYLSGNRPMTSSCYFCAGVTNETAPIALYSEASTLAASAAKMDNFIIDNTLGLNTEVTFDYASSLGVNFVLRSPNGITYSITSNECTEDGSIQIITCSFSGESEVDCIYLRSGCYI